MNGERPSESSGNERKKELRVERVKGKTKGKERKIGKDSSSELLSD